MGVSHKESIFFVYIRLRLDSTCRIELLEEEDYNFATRMDKLFSPTTLKKYQKFTTINQTSMLSNADLKLFAGLSTAGCDTLIV